MHYLHCKAEFDPSVYEMNAFRLCGQHALMRAFDGMSHRQDLRPSDPGLRGEAPGAGAIAVAFVGWSAIAVTLRPAPESRALLQPSGRWSRGVGRRRPRRPPARIDLEPGGRTNHLGEGGSAVVVAGQRRERRRARKRDARMRMEITHTERLARDMSRWNGPGHGSPSGNQHAHDPRAISGAHGAVRGGATGRALWRAPR